MQVLLRLPFVFLIPGAGGSSDDDDLGFESISDWLR